MLILPEPWEQEGRWVGGVEGGGALALIYAVLLEFLYERVARMKKKKKKKKKGWISQEGVLDW